MAYIKHTAIHTTPKATFYYVLNPKKNEDCKYVSGLCCEETAEEAYENFKELYEKYAKENFDNCDSVGKHGKRNVRVHSYTQSFDSSVSADEAHRIGVEWAEKVFGKNRPIIVSTHVNTDHCHNHIFVCPYDMFGVHWNSNKKTLNYARGISDEICLSHGLDIIKNPKRKSTISYKEHDARKKGYSWKVKMADVIDRLILEDDVYDINSLIRKMRERGYVFTNENRMIAKPHNVKYGCCIAKLGYGYSIEMLQKRISNKRNEFVGKKISAYIGFQVEYAVSIRERQKEVYRTPVKSEITYYDLLKQFEALNFIHSNHIHSLTQLRELCSKANSEENYDIDRYMKLVDLKNYKKVLDYVGDEYARLLRTENRTEEQNKRLESLTDTLGSKVAIRDRSDPNWLSKFRAEIDERLRHTDEAVREMNKSSKFRQEAENALAHLESFLKTDYDRIKEEIMLQREIENYHLGLEPQADGTFRAEPEPTAERNAELQYLADKEEKRRQAEARRQAMLEQQRREEEERERSSRRSYGMELF